MAKESKPEEAHLEKLLGRLDYGNAMEAIELICKNKNLVDKLQPQDSVNKMRHQAL